MKASRHPPNTKMGVWVEKLVLKVAIKEMEKINEKKFLISTPYGVDIRINKEDANFESYYTNSKNLFFLVLFKE